MEALEVEKEGLEAGTERARASLAALTAQVEAIQVTELTAWGGEEREHGGRRGGAAGLRVPCP